MVRPLCLAEAWAVWAVWIIKPTTNRNDEGPESPGPFFLCAAATADQCSTSFGVQRWTTFAHAMERLSGSCSSVRRASVYRSVSLQWTNRSVLRAVSLGLTDLASETPAHQKVRRLFLLKRAERRHYFRSARGGGGATISSYSQKAPVCAQWNLPHCSVLASVAVF